MTAVSGRAWLREETRTTILNAARKLFDRGGVETLSLGAVATETGFAPPTVYAYFTNKNDLLVATVANDLADLARAMRGAYPLSEPVFAEPKPPRPVFAPVRELPKEELAVTESEAIALAPAPHLEIAPDPAPVLEAAHEEAPRGPQLFDSLPSLDQESLPPLPVNLPAVGKKRRLLERREITPDPLPEPEKIEVPALVPHPEREETPAQEPPILETLVAAAPEREISSYREAVANAETPTPKVDAWLQRRLRVFEKSLSDIETRLAASEQNSTRAAALAEETSRVLALRVEGAEKRVRDGLDNLAQRLEQSEKRPRGIAPDLRATINDLYARLETIEAGHSHASVAELEAQWSASPASAQEPEEAPAETAKPITDAAETYLTAARRAANAAAQLSEIDTNPGRIAAISPKRLSRSNLIMMLCGALALLLVVYGFVLRDYFAAHAEEPPHPAIATHHVAAIAPSGFDHASALANHGDVGAELALGLDYLNGTGVAKSPAQAARWIQLAAEGGEPVGQYWFGTLYERGAGVRADTTLSFHWYETAAMQGNRRAMYNVAIAYALGRGTARDLGKAADWFKRAADLGYVDAQYNLGVLYERGEGVPQSLSDAYKWYAIAAAAGDSESKSRISTLATQLSSDDLSDAQSAAASFKAEPINRAANLIPTLPAHG